MTAVTIKNNKLKNGGILFEMLVRQITGDTLAGKTTSPAMTLLKKYFNSERELGKELQLYQVFFNSRKLTESKAVQLLDMVIQQRRKLDEKRLDREKYDLIRELKSHYDLKALLSSKIPSYRLHASIYKTFLTEVRHTTDAILNIQDVASARFALIEHLLGTNRKAIAKESDVMQEFRAQSEDVRLLAYKLMIQKFNEKYTELNEQQRTLLQTYIYDTTSGQQILEYVRRVIPELEQSMYLKIPLVTDKVLRIKLTEVLAQLGKMKTLQVIKENHLVALLLGYSIYDEMH